MSTEDDLIELVIIARQQQEKIDQCIAENEKLVAALGQIQAIPNAAIDALRNAVKTTITTEMPNSLKSRTKPLTEAVNAAVGRIEAIKDRGMLPLAVVAFVAGGFGSGLAQVLGHFMK